MPTQFSTKVDNSTLFSVIALAIFFIAFILFKLWYIDVPYFWDESWVYGPAVSAMGERIPSLLSGSIDIELSRGHPMLFHFLGGVWGNIIGNSVISLHIFALLISVTFISSFFFLTTKIYTLRIGSITTMLLLVQGAFLAQSAMVLPEVLVATLALWSIYFFSQKRYFISCIFASLCLLTKESGAILMPALGISYLLHSLYTKEFNWKIGIKILSYLAIACVPYLLFLWFQHRTFGWYLFPNHVDLQVKNADEWQQQFLDATRYVFESQGRIAITITTLGVSVYSFRKEYKILIWLCLLAITAISMMLVPMISFTMFSVFVLAFFGLMTVGTYTLISYKKQYFILLIASVFTFLYLLFTGYNFFSARYILVLLPLFLLAYAQSLKHVGRNWLFSVISVALAIFCVYEAFKSKTLHDTNQAYMDVCYLHKDFIEHLEQKNVYNNPVFAPFLTMEAMKKQHSGYRTTQDSFININSTVPADQKLYVISSSFEGTYFIPGHMEKRRLLDSSRFEKDSHWFLLEIYSEETNEIDTIPTIIE